MSLSCDYSERGDETPNPSPVFYRQPKDFSTFKRKRVATCTSCGKGVKQGDTCLEFVRFTVDWQNDRHYLESHYLCER